MLRHRLSTLLLLILALALLAGCGGDDESEALSVEDYSAQVDEELATFNEEFTALGQEAANPESREQYVEAVTAVRARVTEVVAAIEAIEPPEEAAGFHEGLIVALGGLEDSFTPVIEAAEGTDDEALLQAAEDLQSRIAEFGTQVQELATEAEEAGVEVPNLTGTAG